MIFIERKTEKGYLYETEDIFGTIKFESEKKMKPDILDEAVVAIIKKHVNVGKVDGTVITDKETKEKVKFSFECRPSWEKCEEDDKMEVCSNTPTSTKEPASAETPIAR